MRELHNITCDDYVTEDWQHFVMMNKKIADFDIIVTPDKLHKDPAVTFAKLGKLKKNARLLEQIKINFR